MRSGREDKLHQCNRLIDSVLCIQRDHIEHQKPDKIMRKEFENWPGGWDVIKHRPFVSTMSDMISKLAGLVLSLIVDFMLFLDFLEALIGGTDQCPWQPGEQRVP